MLPKVSVKGYRKGYIGRKEYFYNKIIGNYDENKLTN